MTKEPATSKKRILIDKNNATMVIVIAVMAFVTVFSVISCRALLGQRSYKARVIKEQKIALNQLKLNNDAAAKLENSYKAFVSSQENVIKGTISGTGPNDGDNAKIILDALPSKYDFPAVATTLEKILTSQNFEIEEIAGTDDEINQSIPLAANTKLAPIEIPFSFSVTGSFDSAQVLMDTLQRSIRPIKVSSLSLKGSDSKLLIVVSATTFYQPEKAISITTKVVK
jgi:hypothetical protein